MDLSICVTTFNRSSRLRECLQSLLRFADQDFELIVGDNASDDGTPAVIEECAVRFKNFLHVRHRENIGFARNADSILRRACRKYIYILHDDDTLFEEAMSVAISLMDRDSAIVAVMGSYLSVRRIQDRYRPDFSDAVATIIPRNDFESLFDNLELCDGNPIMRRATFQTKCAYLEGTNIIPLYFRLLNYGAVVHVNKPFFQHRTSSVSLTSRMSESWFLDMANADLELAVRYSRGVLTQQKLADQRAKLLRLLYFQAVRMAFLKKLYYVAWLFLMRLKGIGGGTDLLYLKSEKEFMPLLLLDRIKQIIFDSECRSIKYQSNPLLITISDWLRKEMEGIDVQPVVDDQRKYADAAVLCFGGHAADSNSNDVSGTPLIDVAEIFDHLRLTDHAARVEIVDGSIKIIYHDQAMADLAEQPSHEFALITAPYSEL